MNSAVPPGNIRAFVAVPISETVREAIRRELRCRHEMLPSPPLRWVSPEQLHLTLRFFGSVASAKVEELARALERAVAGIPPFSLAAEGFGAFLCSGKPRVLWVGIGGQVESLLALQRRVESGTSSFGEPPDPRPFHPHISVARVKNATVAEGGRILRCIGGLGEKSAGSWLVDRVELIQSRPSPAGSIYTCLKSIVLAGA